MQQHRPVVERTEGQEVAESRVVYGNVGTMKVDRLFCDRVAHASRVLAVDGEQKFFRAVIFRQQRLSRYARDFIDTPA